MRPLRCTECSHCELTESDGDGNQDLIFDPACPVHGYDEQAVVSPADRLTGNPHDAVKDLKAERAHDGVFLTTDEIVRSTRNFDRAHPHLRFGRHLSGLPPVVAPPNPGGHPTGLRPVSPPAAGEQAGGLDLPDLAA